jgi:hypothetical protein
VIALDGWYHRTLNALHIAESKTRRLGALNCRFFFPLFSNFIDPPSSVLPVTLHRKVPRVEHRGVALLRLLVFECGRGPTHLLHGSPPLLAERKELVD